MEPYDVLTARIFGVGLVRLVVAQHAFVEAAVCWSGGLGLEISQIFVVHLRLPRSWCRGGVARVGVSDTTYAGDKWTSGMS